MPTIRKHELIQMLRGWSGVSSETLSRHIYGLMRSRCTTQIYKPSGTDKKPKCYDEWRDKIMYMVAAKSPWQSSQDGPFILDADFAFLRPKSHLTSKGSLTSAASLHHVQKPDKDNLDKLVCDAITRTQKVWRDDCQVIGGVTTKKWTTQREKQGVTIRIQRVEEQSPTLFG